MNIINPTETFCERTRAQLDAYVSHELTAGRTREIASHPAGCRLCAEARAARQRVKHALQHALAHDAPAPLALRERICHALRQAALLSPPPRHAAAWQGAHPPAALSPVTHDCPTRLQPTRDLPKMC